MNSTKYSVIIPVYNAESSLRETLTSVMRQTLPPHRVIIVNDASTDRTLQILNDFNVEVINNTENLGSGLSRSKALELIEDGIVAIIDSDDTWDIDYGQRMMMLWNKAPAKTGAIGMLLRPEGNLDKSGYLRQNSRLQRRGFTHISATTLAWHNPFYASATSFDSTIIKVIGGWGAKRHSYNEDYSLLARIFDSGYALFMDPLECGSYTISLGQKSANVKLVLPAQIAIINFIANSKQIDQTNFHWLQFSIIKFGVWCRSIIQMLNYNQTEIPKLSILGESRILVLLDQVISKAVTKKILLIPFKIIRYIRRLASF